MKNPTPVTPLEKPPRWQQCLHAGHQARKKGVTAAAEKLYLAALKEVEALPPADERLQSVLLALGSHYTERGKFATAETHIQRAWKIQAQSTGPDDPSVVPFLNQLARLYTLESRYEEAETLLTGALHIIETSPQSNYNLRIGSLCTLASLYLTERKYDQAEPLLRRAMVAAEDIVGSPHPSLPAIMGMYADLMHKLDRHIEAEIFQNNAKHLRQQSPQTLSPAV